MIPTKRSISSKEADRVKRDNQKAGKSFKCLYQPKEKSTPVKEHVQLNLNLHERITQKMEDVENRMVSEARQQFIMEQAAELMEVDNPNEDAQREYLLDEIDRTKVVGGLLDAAGLWSIRDVVSFFEEANLDELQILKDDLEAYDQEEKDHDHERIN